MITLFLLVGCKHFDPNDLLDPTTTIIKKILTGGKSGD
jgi:hypothetical protein